MYFQSCFATFNHPLEHLNSCSSKSHAHCIHFSVNNNQEIPTRNLSRLYVSLRSFKYCTNLSSMTTRTWARFRLRFAFVFYNDPHWKLLNFFLKESCSLLVPVSTFPDKGERRNSDLPIFTLRFINVSHETYQSATVNLSGGWLPSFRPRLTNVPL